MREAEAWLAFSSYMCSLLSLIPLLPSIRPSPPCPTVIDRQPHKRHGQRQIPRDGIPEFLLQLVHCGNLEFLVAVPVRVEGDRGGGRAGDGKGEQGGRRDEREERFQCLLKFNPSLRVQSRNEVMQANAGK